MWLNQPYGQVPISYDTYVKNNPALETILNNGPCITWILDLRTLHFSFLSQNVQEIFGYSNQIFKEKGLTYLNQIVHPDDVAPTWLRVIQNWQYLIALPPLQRKEQKLNIRYRIIKPNGKIMQVLEQSTVLQQDDLGHVTHLMGVCSDISLLEKIEDEILTTKPIGHKVKDLNTPVSDITQAILSKRELQIVKLIAAGYKSRDIARELFISFHTVNTHRQKMIEKTNSKNTGELIQYVMTRKLIKFD
ncbi:LuxR C-terminal-related transcriptional regulator [Adhaeribacter rhizoryzae]|nr:LuxR C-terminal-related transcriptional regulator [Adhaeribacter rhizoryzae]